MKTGIKERKDVQIKDMEPSSSSSKIKTEIDVRDKSKK